MIEIPNELKLFLTFIITQGVKSFANLFGVDIEGKVSAITAAIVGGLIFFARGIIEIVPPEQQEVVVAAMQFAAVLLGAFGSHYIYKNIGNSR